MFVVPIVHSCAVPAYDLMTHHMLTQSVHFTLYICAYVSNTQHRSVADILTWLYEENYKEQVGISYY